MIRRLSPDAPGAPGLDWPVGLGRAGALSMGRGCNDRRPPGQGTPPLVDIHPQPLRFASEAQQAVAAACARQASLTGALRAVLKETGLLAHCTLLAAAPGGPLTFRYIGVPTRRILGEEWARGQLGRPDEEDPHQDFSASVGVQYRRAIEGGEPVLNRVFCTGVTPAPFAYTHLLFGFSLPTGERAVLSCVQL